MRSGRREAGGGDDKGRVRQGYRTGVSGQHGGTVAERYGHGDAQVQIHGLRATRQHLEVHLHDQPEHVQPGSGQGHDGTLSGGRDSGGIGDKAEHHCLRDTGDGELRQHDDDHHPELRGQRVPLQLCGERGDVHMEIHQPRGTGGLRVAGGQREDGELPGAGGETGHSGGQDAGGEGRVRQHADASVRERGRHTGLRGRRGIHIQIQGLPGPRASVALQIHDRGRGVHDHGAIRRQHGRVPERGDDADSASCER